MARAEFRGHRPFISRLAHGRAICIGVVAALAGGLVWLPTTAATAAPLAPEPTPSPYTAARLLAEQSGRAVEVSGQTTETSQVMAEPDGTYQLTSSLTAVRVKQNGAWRPIDTTLVRRPDGTLGPQAAAEDVAFSGGGSSPAVTVRDGATSLSFTWPTALPKPQVSGDSATYAGVLPGVDLVLTAHAESYSEVLVVRDAAAAADPQLAKLAFGVSTHGLHVARDAQGGLSARNDNGVELFHGSAPTMWDSFQPPGDSRPTATRPGPGRVTKLSLSVDGSSLSLVPPAAALTGPGVHYPVFIDPSLAPPRAHFAVVTTQSWNYYDDTSNDLKVGDCAWSACAGTWKARTYLSFSTAALTGQATTAKVYDAEVDVYEIHNAGDCTAEPVDLYTAGSISSSTVWPGPLGSKLDEVSSNLGDGCNNTAGDVRFGAAAVISRFQTAANSDTSTLIFGLKSPDESNMYQWKRFSSAGGSSGAAAQIIVKYDFPPSTPSGLSMDNTVVCSGNPTYTRDTTPTLHAHATDYNTPHLPVALHFEVDNSNGMVRKNPTGVSVSSGATASWSTNSSNSNSTAGLPDGAYKYDAYATSSSPDTTDTAGGTSGWVSFTLDTKAPNVPAISSFDYPQGTWGTTSQGKFSFTSSSDAAGFAYSFDSSGTEPLPADTTCSYTTTPTTSGGRVTATSGSATITIPALTPGYHSLYVKSFDDAHNVSTQVGPYDFYVAPAISGEGTTKFEAESYTPTVSGTSCDDTGCPSYIEGPSTRWSNGSQLHLVADQGSPAAPARWASTVTTNVEADYAIDVQVTTQNHYGILQFRMDGQLLAAPDGTTNFDTYSPSVGTMNIALGGKHLTAGAHTISYDLVGTDPAEVNYTYSGNYGTAAVPINFADNGYSAGIDYVRVIPINAATYGSFNSAMNNDGVTVDTGAAGDIGPSKANQSLSQTTLVNAGFGPGATITVDSGSVDQTTFVMPSYNANGNDNVIAMGQTIPLPAPTAANYVDLLVASTCGDSLYKPSTEVTVNFADGGFSQTLTPLVPDYLNGSIVQEPGQDADITLAATLPYLRTGTTSSTSVNPKLYHLAIPTKNNGSAVTSITLPYQGSDLSDSCAGPSMHIFAVSTH